MKVYMVRAEGMGDFNYGWGSVRKTEKQALEDANMDIEDSHRYLGIEWDDTCVVSEAGSSYEYNGDHGRYYIEVVEIHL